MRQFATLWLKDYLISSLILSTTSTQVSLVSLYQDYVPNLNLNCRYFTAESFNSSYDQMNRKNVTNAVSLCHINIRSIAKNLKHFEYFLAGLKHDFTFIGITETWLTNYNDDLYTLNGYTNVGKHRQDRKGGGGCSVVHKRPFDFQRAIRFKRFQ